MMNIAIELIVMIAVVGALIAAYFWHQISKWYHNKRYKPENDKGRIYQRPDYLGIAKPTGAVKRNPGVPKQSIQSVEDLPGNRKSSNGTGKVGNPFKRK